MRFAIRFDTTDMRKDRQDAVVAWVRSLGLDPDNFRSQAVILQGEASYELHLSEVVRGESGDSIVDRAINDVVSRPHVVDLGQSKCWPAWLGTEADAA